MSAGLEISRVVFDGDRVEVVVGDANVDRSAFVPDTPQEARTLEEYKRWRDKGRLLREPKL